MQKQTETFKLRYLRPTFKSKMKRILPTYTYKGLRRALLSSGEEIKREVTPTDNLMQTILQTEEYREEKKGSDWVRNRYLYLELECSLPNKKPSDYPDQDFETLERNRMTVNFYKFHNEVCTPDGNEKNTNPNQLGERNYELINLDKIEADKVWLSELENRVMNDLHSIYSSEEDFINLAYLMGVNPTGLNPNMVFNTLSTIVRKDRASMEDFDKKMNRDNDRWIKVVINKALRTIDRTTGENHITQDSNKMYRINGVHVASNYETLVAYMKDNEKLFNGIEDSLGMKASGRFVTNGPEQKNKSEAEKINEAASISQEEINAKVDSVIKKLTSPQGKYASTQKIAFEQVERFKVRCGAELSESFMALLEEKAKEAGVTLPTLEVV